MKSISLILLFMVLGAVVLVSGCLGVSMYTTVNSNGKITEVTTELNMSSSNFDMLKSMIEASSPGTDMKTYMVENFSKSYGGPETKIDYIERTADGYTYVTLRAHGPDVQPKEGNISVTREGDSWVYRYDTSEAESSAGVPEDTSSYTEAMANMITMDFYVTMPGKITDSNAHKVTGNKAEWHYNLENIREVSTLYAKSAVAKSPGFEAVAALLAIAAGAGLFAVRKKNE